jgi:hypothetical protein
MPFGWICSRMKATLIETFRSGTLGLLFRAFELRIGHYGPRFALLFVADHQAWHLLLQHFIVGCLLRELSISCRS